MTTIQGQSSSTTQAFYLPQQLRDIFSHKGSIPENLHPRKFMDVRINPTVIYLSHLISCVYISIMSVNTFKAFFQFFLYETQIEIHLIISELMILIINKNLLPKTEFM